MIISGPGFTILTRITSSPRICGLKCIFFHHAGLKENMRTNFGRFVRSSSAEYIFSQPGRQYFAVYAMAIVRNMETPICYFSVQIVHSKYMYIYCQPRTFSLKTDTRKTFAKRDRYLISGRNT